ncbi:MAG: ParA family protein [bacterium]|nr:ParA family protein [bacterium]
MAEIISISNQKGGCGKTTTAVNLSAALALTGKKVLLIDLDPQGSASLTFGINIEDILISMTDVLLDEDLDFEYNIFKKGNIHIAPATLSLHRAELEMMDMDRHEERLKRKLDKIQHRYDYVIIDCPPRMGILVSNALAASRWIIVPVDVGFYSLVGLRQILKKIEEIRVFNGELQIMGFLIVRYDHRNMLSRQVQDKLKHSFPDNTFDTCIRPNIRLAESPSYQKTIFEYDKSSHGAEDYYRMAKEVIAWQG